MTFVVTPLAALAAVVLALFEGEKGLKCPRKEHQDRTVFGVWKTAP
jgi:hypothetical protein